MPQMNIWDAAERLYRRYTKQTGNKTYDGKDCPTWSALPKHVQQAWVAAFDEATILLAPEEHQPPSPEILPPPREARPVGPNGE